MHSDAASAWSAGAAGLQRWRRGERTFVRLRWATVVFALVQVLTYYIPHPPGFLELSLAVTGLLALGNAAVALAVPRVTGQRAAAAVSLASLLLDSVVVLAFVGVYTFDPETAVWALVYLLPLEAAVRYGLRGALLTMAAVTVVYTIREALGTVVYGNEFLLQSISFRMGIGFIVAAVAGGMASRLVRERDELQAAKAAVDRYAADLSAANAQLQQVAKLKDDFLAMTNHELRTPMTAVLGYASMLAQQWDQIPEERRRDFVGIIRDQAERLQGLVEDVLTLSSLQAGAVALRLEQAEVSASAQEAIRDLGPAGPPVDNRCPPGLAVRADPDRLVQILSNYLANAVKYGEGPIVVDAIDEDSTVVVRVSDHGAGVPAEFVPRLFDKFTRADRDDGASGSGLGLAIVRLLAEAHGGSAWYEPVPGGGARFCVRLPAA